MINSSDPLFVQFVKDLRGCISCSLPQDALSNEMDVDVETPLEPPDSLHTKSKNFEGVGDMSNIDRRMDSSKSRESSPSIAAPSSYLSNSERSKFILNLLASALNLRDEESDSKHSSCFNDPKPNVEELEMLIEAYFARINGIVWKLSDMREYVDDTEDVINIMMDDKQNQLLQMAITLNTANMIINGGIVVVGLFGMNVPIKLFDSEPVGNSMWYPWRLYRFIFNGRWVE